MRNRDSTKEDVQSEVPLVDFFKYMKTNSAQIFLNCSLERLFFSAIICICFCFFFREDLGK